MYLQCSCDFILHHYCHCQTSDGKLKVGQNLPKFIKLFLSERLCKNLGSTSVTCTLKTRNQRLGIHQRLISIFAIAMSILCLHLIVNDSKKLNTLVIMVITNKNWHCAKKINYLSLTINNLTHFEINIVDFDNDLLNFDKTQTIIVLLLK